MESSDLHILMTELCGCVFTDDPYRGLIAHQSCKEHDSIPSREIFILEEACKLARDRLAAVTRPPNTSGEPSTRGTVKRTPMGQLVESIKIAVELNETILGIRTPVDFLAHSTLMARAMSLVEVHYRTIYPKGDSDERQGKGGGPGSGSHSDVDGADQTGTSEKTSDDGGRPGPTPEKSGDAER